MLACVACAGAAESYTPLHARTLPQLSHSVSRYVIHESGESSEAVRDETGTFLQFDAEAAHFFKSLGSINLSVVNVAFNEPVLKQKGFGYLIPSNQDEDILGVVFDSCIFPEQNQSENIASGDLLDLMRRAKCFGINLAKLDIRQESLRHSQLLAESVSYTHLTLPTKA